MRKAAEEGAFDNLPGKGKPLKWTSERDDDMWLARHVLKNAGFAPEWIESGKRLRVRRAETLERLSRFAGWWRSASRDSRDRARETAEAQFREAAAGLNREIDSHNLSCPVASAQIARIRIDAEVAAWREGLL